MFRNGDLPFYLRVCASRADVDALARGSAFIAEADEPAYRAWLERMRKNGYRPYWVHAIDSNGPMRIAALAARNPEDIAWESHIDRGPREWDKSAMDLLMKRKFRLASLACDSQAGEAVFVSIWHKVAYAPYGDHYLWYRRNATQSREKIADEINHGKKPVAMVEYPDQGWTYYGVFGVSLDATYRTLGPELEFEPLLKERRQQTALGYRPVSFTSRSDGSRRRFAMVLWRDDPATTWDSLSVASRRLGLEIARREAGGFRSEFLTPVDGSRPYYVGWTRHDPPSGGETVPALAGLETALKDFMHERGIRGATLAVARNGQVLLSRSFGWSDRNATKPMAPGDPMRLASLSKRFTAAAIHKLIRDGKLKSDQKVVELLDLKAPPGKTMDPRWAKVTIQNLIDHRGGWRSADGGDPMLNPPPIAAEPRRPLPPSAREIIEYMAGQPLQFEPGTDRAYSDFGYCLLGRVIGRVTGRSYIDSIRALVLEPLTIEGVDVGRSLPQDRNSLEPEYVHPGDARNLFSTDQGAKIRHPDGGLSIEALDSTGGLIAPAADVARFFSHYGGREGRPDPPNDKRSVFTGQLPGTYAMALRLPGNLVIVVLCNQSVSVSGAPMNALSGLMERAAGKVQSWPTTELDRR